MLRRFLCAAVLILCSVLPSSAAAQGEPGASAAADRPQNPGAWAAWAAEQAAAVLDEHCSDVAAGRATESARALAAVAPMLEEVSAAHDATGLPYLRFWRGRLNLCLDRQDRAREDLVAFLEVASSDPAYRPQVRFAGTLLRRLGAGRSDSGLGIAAGIGLLGAGVALGGLAAWQGEVAKSRRAAYAAGVRSWEETAEIGKSAERARLASGVLAGLAAGSATGGVLTLIVSAARGRAGGSGLARHGSRASPRWSLAGGPLPGGGGAIVLAGAW